jgi:hypothetical protein
LEDLSAINYRLQGLAEKKPHKKLVLMKRIKHRVRSIKECGWTGFGETIRSRGFLIVLLRHKKRDLGLLKRTGV